MGEELKRIFFTDRINIGDPQNKMDIIIIILNDEAKLLCRANCKLQMSWIGSL